MIKSVSITNHLGETLKIVLSEENPDSGFIITNIDGLGAAKADVNTTKLAANDGTIYNSARLEQRNIVLELLLTFSPQVEDARQRTYQFFPIKKEVTLLFETDNRNSTIKGYVETNEPDIFSEKEKVQISLICPDPYFHSDKVNRTVFSGIDPLFEFIFSNESLDENLIEFGSIEVAKEKSIFYTGDADVGIIMRIHAIGPAKMVSIYNIKTRESMTIDTDKLEKLTGSGIVTGDDIIINTNRGNKSIQLLRHGAYVNILNCLDRGADWFRLVKGNNIFAYVADEGAENLYFSIDNEVVYEGV